MIGKKLKELRTTKGLKQTEIADKLNVSVSTVQKWEQDISDPNTEKVIELVDLLGTTVDYMLGLTETKTGKEFLLIEKFNGLTEDQQIEVMRYMDYLSKMR